MNMHNEIFINEIRLLTQELEAGKNIGGLRLAKIIKKLTELEIEEGGPYSFEPENGIPGVDLPLNVAIAGFLALQDIHLPKLDAYLAEHIVKPNQDTKKAETKDGTEITSVVYDDGEQRIMDLIRQKFDERFAEFAPDVRKRARDAIEKTIRGNEDKQMSLMAHYTRAAFGREGEKITDETVAEMGLANIFFWTAFIIYDDFWDKDEAADPKLLPIANVFARHYTDYFSAILLARQSLAVPSVALAKDRGVGGPQETGFRQFFHTLMDNLDAANAWETEHCRARVENNIFYIPHTLPKYEDYENKFRPASGHILGSVALLVKQGFALDGSEVAYLVDYFRHYLVAMQLNDDAHDWEEDLARGHLSTVVVMLLSDLKKSGWHKSSIDLSADLPELRKIFWFNIIPRYVEDVLLHTTRSREALQKLRGVLENLESLERVIIRNENVAKEAQKECMDSEALLKEYSV